MTKPMPEPDTPLHVVTCAALEYANVLDRQAKAASLTQERRDELLTEAMEIRACVAEVDPDW